MDNKIRYRVIYLLIFLLSATPAMALEVNQHTWFNSLTDSLATIGKSDRDKKQIKRLRKKSRREYREQKQRIKNKSNMQKRLKQQQKDLKSKYNSGHTRIGL